MRPGFLLALVLSATGQAPAQEPILLTDLQLIGTHNSYHAGLAPNEAAMLRKISPDTADSLAYKHVPLDVQLNMGVRQFEFDVFADTKGGLFADPAAPRQLAKAGLPGDPPAYKDGVLSKPGFKVIHVQDLDYRSNCQPFRQCLSILREWSKAHPRHLPIFILVENKDGRPRDYMVEPEKLTTATFDALDAEIRSVFRREDLITPDDVRGTSRTLEEAVLRRGWPALDKARGKFVFLLDQERVTPLYTDGHSSLEGRVMFTNATPGTPDAAFVKRNDPRSPEIPELVRKGYLVRTMTDGGHRAVAANDGSRRDAALASGAQLLSTDYPFAYAHASGYSVRFAGGIVRCNPVRARRCDTVPLGE
jgi:hypothetical protein